MLAKNVQNLIRRFILLFFIIHTMHEAKAQGISLGIACKYQHRLNDIITTMDVGFTKFKQHYTYGVGTGMKVPFLNENSFFVQELTGQYSLLRMETFQIQVGSNLFYALQRVEKMHSILIPSLNTAIRYGKDFKCALYLGYGPYLEIVPDSNFKNVHWSTNATIGIAINYEI
jgi:hypothetical protein